jgi:hypothetical protein
MCMPIYACILRDHYNPACTPPSTNQTVTCLGLQWGVRHMRVIHHHTFCLCFATEKEHMNYTSSHDYEFRTEFDKCCQHVLLYNSLIMVG